MFTQFFNLRLNPFTKEIPVDKLFLSQNLVELTFRLMYLQKARGIGLIIGEASTGKSTALRKYAQSLNPALFQSRLAFGGTHEELFTVPSVEAIYGVTSGVPRLVNSLATNCLLYACEKKQRQVDEETVYQAQSELNF